MKKILINDVPKNIKAISFYGDINDEKIINLQKEIENIKDQIRQIENKEDYNVTNIDLLNYEILRETLSKKLKELDDLKKIKNAENKLIANEQKQKNNKNLLIIFYAIGILFLLRKRKR